MKKCLTQSDLHEEYARVLRMIENTYASIKSCIKYDGETLEINAHLPGSIKKYEFAIVIIENRPVFSGDILYRKDSADEIKTTLAVVMPDGTAILLDDKGKVNRVEDLTWDKPETKPGKYDHIKIDDKVLVWDLNESNKNKRHFAGVSSEGAPMAWSRGKTSFSSLQDDEPTSWNNCELYTGEE